MKVLTTMQFYKILDVRAPSLPKERSEIIDIFLHVLRIVTDGGDKK